MTLSQHGSLRYRNGLSRNIWNRLFTSIAALFTGLAVLPLVLVLAYVLIKGGSLINWQLLTELPPPPGLDGGGIGNAIVGTLLITVLASAIAIPCLLYTSPSPRDQRGSRMPSSA